MKRLLTTENVRDAYAISRSSLYRRLKSAQLPPPIKINGRNYWSSEVIDKHIAELIGEAGEAS